MTSLRTKIAKELAEFVSEYGDPYELKDQMDYDETQDEYVDRLSNELAAALESYSDTIDILADLANYQEPDTDPQAKQIATHLTHEIQKLQGEIA